MMTLALLRLILTARLAGYHTTFRTRTDGTFELRLRRIEIVEAEGMEAA